MDVMTQIVSFTPDFAAAAAVVAVVVFAVVPRLSHVQFIVGAQLIFIGS